MSAPPRTPPLRVGERVKLTSIPDAILQGLAERDAAFLRGMVGKVVPVMGFNAKGELELEFATRELIFHTIWVPPSCVKRLGKPP